MIEAKGATPQTFPVDAIEKPKATPNWHSLYVFPIALGGAVLVMVLVGAVFYRKDFRNPLEHLEASWSFSDSWATNITAAGGLVAAILSSTETLTTLFGQDAKGPVALATVGAAMGAAIAGAASLALGATKTKENFDSVSGLLLAAGVTVAGAVGELYIFWKASKELSIANGGHELAGVAFGVAVVLLLVYAGRSIFTTIRQATQQPSEAPSETMQAAEKIVAALKALSDDKADTTAKAIAPHLRLIASRVAGERRAPRRSTLL